LRSLTVKQLHDVSWSLEKERDEKREREREKTKSRFSRPFEKKTSFSIAHLLFLVRTRPPSSATSSLILSLSPSRSRKQAIAADPTGDGDLDIDGAPVNNVRFRCFLISIIFSIDALRPSLSFSTFSLSYLSLTLDLLPLSKLESPPPQLTLVGKILGASEHASSTVLRVDDGTGIVSIKYWGDNDDEGGAAGDDGAAARRAAWQPGAYIRVHGNLRAFDGARSLVAFNVRPVADHNEITYHLAQCMLQHAHLSRASSGGATAIAANAAGGVAAAPAAAAKAENAAGGDPNAVGADGLTGAQREAKAQVAALGGGPQGAAVDDIVAALSGRVSEALVRDAVGFLLEEGHLYSTVDENHVKVA